MKLPTKTLMIVFLLFSLILILGNPSERNYLNRVAKDYGATHHGLNFDAQSLLTLGESSRSNYLLWSTYTYRFGNVSVTYVGVVFQIFFLHSGIDTEHKKGNETITA